METHTKVSKICTRAVIISSVGLAIFSIINLWLNKSGKPLSSENQFAFYMLLLSPVLFYLVKMVDAIHSLIKEIRHGKYTMVYRNTDEFYQKLTKGTVNCQEVYTHMLSDPPKIIGKQALKYFNAVHKKVMDQSRGIKIFRRICTVHSRDKACWIIDSLLELQYANSFSLAIQYVDDGYPQTSFHVSVGQEKKLLFVWATICSGGFGQGFSVEDSEVAEVMKEEHNREFHRSIALKEGSKIYYEHLDELARRYKLDNYKNYRELVAGKMATVSKALLIE